jgi:hypothetical protein
MRELPCGNCGSQDGTVVAAHRNQGKGMGIKNSDALVAALCYRCHFQLDQGGALNKEQKRSLWDQSYIVTMQYLIEKELLSINGRK